MADCPRHGIKEAGRDVQAARDVLKALHAKHCGGIDPQAQWVFFEELRVGTGWRKPVGEVGEDREQRMDAWAMNLWPSRGFLAIAYEVKVTRADFLHELKRPGKRVAAMSLSNEFYFATPAGLVSEYEIPEGCGLIEVHKRRASSLQAPWTKIVLKAPRREREPLPETFVASLLRRSMREAV